jgi:hypothetical protein
MRNNIDNSSVFKDFVKIAQSYGWVKEADDAKVIQDKYNITDGTGKELIDKAHPNEIWVAEALGDGGLVENQNEQHETLMSILYKMPEGSLIGRHAELVNSLTKTADQAYMKGNISSYNKINNSIEIINDNFYKKAGVLSFVGTGLMLLVGKQLAGKWAPNIIGKGLITGGTLAGLAGMASKITSRQEKLSIDLKDAIGACDDLLDDDRGALDKVTNFLGMDTADADVKTQVEIIKNHLLKFQHVFDGKLPTDQAKVDEYIKNLKKLDALLVGNGPVAVMLSSFSEKWYKLGLGEISILKEKIVDIRVGIKKAYQSLLALDKIGKIKVIDQKLGEKEGKGGISSGIESLLERAGYSTKEGVTSALKTVEKELSQRFGKSLSSKSENPIGELIKPDGRTVSADSLAKLLKAMGKV